MVEITGKILRGLKSVKISGREVLPIIEGGKGVGVSNGESSGAFAASGAVGTFSGVNAEAVDENGKPLALIYKGKTRKERHDELIEYSIKGALHQARVAYETACSKGPIHMNILWEMAAAEKVLHNVLEKAKGIVSGVTCGAGMPYRLASIAEHYKVHYYPIVSSMRAFRALWKRAYNKVSDFLGGVVYEDPWKAGGHNGLSNNEDPESPEDPYPRVSALRKFMKEVGLDEVPIIMAGGVWYLREWEHWLDNPEIGPIAFQFGTRPILTKESPVSDDWKKKLLTLNEGDVMLNRFSPTGFYSSAVKNDFMVELEQRGNRQIPFSKDPVGELQVPYPIGPRQRIVYISPTDKVRADIWAADSFDEAIRTPDSTLIFVSKEKAKEITKDQVDCMGCLSACKFSSWATGGNNSTGRKADPRSYCIQKTLQNIIKDGDIHNELMFAGHNAYKFASDPFYSNGFIPTTNELVNRIMTGD